MKVSCERLSLSIPIVLTRARLAFQFFALCALQRDDGKGHSAVKTPRQSLLAFGKSDTSISHNPVALHALASWKITQRVLVNSRFRHVWILRNQFLVKRSIRIHLPHVFCSSVQKIATGAAATLAATATPKLFAIKLPTKAGAVRCVVRGN